MTQYPWPVAECLHEHKQEQEVVINFVGEVVRIEPAWCPECGYRWEPVEPEDYR